ncbi:hypothetical protein F5Y03DRAFT_1915 [Xylaria venustula]|nr:hypothetical protein F5Y03DRAFT_1915 [Xylaria venustula]
MEAVIPGSSTWGPRYVAQRHADNEPIPTETASTSQFVTAYFSKATKARDGGSSDSSLSPVPRRRPLPKNPKGPSTKRKDLGKAPAGKPPGTGNSTRVSLPTPKRSGSGKIPAGLPSPPKSDRTRKPSTGNPFIKNEEDNEKDAKQTPLDDIFRNSKNTSAEAERVRKLRSRAFTSVSSIFTNPLKPVMPLYGPPLESVIKTGPSMPGVSIAMLTPTEVLRLQKEVHSLRFQLLDRTRECPYADCDRYFTFSDGEGLDRHVREDHNTLRCFLCDKNQTLLPYYNTDKIKEHFVTEHLDEILKAYGKAPVAEGAGKSEAGPRPKKTTFAVPWNYDSQEEDAHSPDDASLADGWAGVKPATLQKGVSGPSGVKGQPPLPQPPKPKGPQKKGGSASERPSENTPNVWEEKAKELRKLQSQNEPTKPTKPTTPATGKTPGSAAGGKGNRSQSTFQPRSPGRQKDSLRTKSPKVGSNAFLEKLQKSVHRKESGKPDTESVKGPEPEEAFEEGKKPAPKGTQTGSKPVKTPATPAKPIVTKTTDPDTKPEIFTAVNPKPGTFQENDAWIKDTLDKYVAEGGKTLYGMKRDDVPFNVFSAPNPNPGTFQENDAYISNRLEQYRRLGGSPQYARPKISLEQKIANLLSVGAHSAVAGGEEKEEEEAEDEEEVGAKRKRRADDDQGSGSEIYEYSERSAVSDDPGDLVADAPRSPKRARKVQIVPPPTPATPARSTRSGRVTRVPAPLSSPSSPSDSDWVQIDNK